MNLLKKTILSPYLSWAFLLAFALGHGLLLFGQLHLGFRSWLTSQDLLFKALFSLFLNAWVYSVALLAAINLIRIWFINEPQARKMFRSWVKPMASLKLAIFTMLLLATLTAIGTIVESRYDLEAAQKLVYHTWWMYGALALLCINLLAVIIERIPWQAHHLSFILAHIGIIVLILGALETAKKGVDGSMSLAIGQSNRFVTLSETDIGVFTSFDGDRYTELYREEFDVFDHSLTDKPITLPLGETEVRITEALRYVVAKDSIAPTEGDRGGPALRFQVNNANVNVSEWLLKESESKEAEYDFGPAQLFFVTEFPDQAPGANQIYVKPSSSSQKDLEYQVFSRTDDRVMSGELSEGDSFTLPWMGLVFRVLRYIPQAERKWDVTPLSAPTPISTSALKVLYQGKQYWLLKNDLLKFFTENAVYIVSYRNRRLDVGFPIKLEAFEVGRYQGTNRASSYASQVEVPGMGEQVISMNEPLKRNGYTFYQASFQEDEAGKPTASVLSVNQDPGRWEKYLGSLLITMGVIMMFWFRKRKAKKNPM